MKTGIQVALLNVFIICLFLKTCFPSIQRYGKLSKLKVLYIVFVITYRRHIHEFLYANDVGNISYIQVKWMTKWIL